MTKLTTDVAKRNLAIVKGFAERLNQVLDSLDYPRHYAGRYTQLANRYGVSVQTSRKWCKGLGVPSPAVLLEMARDFDTTIDALLDGHGLIQVRPLPPLVSIPVYELSGVSSGTRHTDFAQTNSVIASNLPFVTHQQQSKMAFVINWVDLRTPEARVGDVLLVGLDCLSVVEGGTYIVRTESMTTLRCASVSLSNEVRFTKVSRSGVSEDTPVLMDHLLFNAATDFLAPVAPDNYLIVGRVLGFYRESEASQAASRRKND